MSNSIDYPAMLADMEAKRDSLIASIANLRAFLGLPAEGNGGDGSRSSPNPGQSVSVASELPKGALLNKSIPEAIKLYLKSVAAKRTTREITEALQAHGVESLSSNFPGIVFTALKRLKHSQEVLRFEDGWGLAEFYPAHIRAAMTVAPSKARKKKGGKAKTKLKAKAHRGPKTEPDKPEAKAGPDESSQEEGIGSRLEKFVNTLATPLGSGEIAEALNIKRQIAALLLSKLAFKSRIAKTEDGKFGPNSNSQKFSKAS